MIDNYFKKVNIDNLIALEHVYFFIDKMRLVIKNETNNFIDFKYDFRNLPGQQISQFKGLMQNVK